MWHSFIPTIQQLLPNHKFKMRTLYTVFVCVCFVFDCWLKHFTVETSCWLKDPLKLLKGKGLQHHQSFWLQSVASKRQHLERIRCKTPVILPQEFRKNNNNNNKNNTFWEKFYIVTEIIIYTNSHLAYFDILTKDTKYTGARKTESITYEYICGFLSFKTHVTFTLMPIIDSIKSKANLYTSWCPNHPHMWPMKQISC